MVGLWGHFLSEKLVYVWRLGLLLSRKGGEGKGGSDTTEGSYRSPIGEAQLCSKIP